MTTWRTDPALQGRFHAEFADDLQVMVHDGEPRRTKKPPEACFVRVTEVAGALRIPHAPPNATPPVPASALQWTIDEYEYYHVEDTHGQSVVITGSSLTVSEYAECWLEGRERRGVCSVVDERKRLSYILLIIGHLPLRGVRPMHIRDMVRAMYLCLQVHGSSIGAADS